MHSSSEGLTTQRESVPIVFACDAGFAMPLATTMRSIVETNRPSWPVAFYVLSDGFSDDIRKRVSDSLIEGSASICWIPVGLDTFQAFSTMAYVSRMAYARLLIAQVLPKDISRVLYLDADVLVLDDLRPIWSVDLQGAVVGAVLDRLDPHIKRGRPGLETLPRVQGYFNSGVLLIDIERWRAERITERSLDYLSLHPNCLYMDQDALNFVCDGLWKSLDSRWNFSDHHDIKIMELGQRERPAIVHFVWKLKPWQPGSLNVNAALYESFRSRTHFAGPPTELQQPVQTRDPTVVADHEAPRRGRPKKLAFQSLRAVGQVLRRYLHRRSPASRTTGDEP